MSIVNFATVTLYVPRDRSRRYSLIVASMFSLFTLIGCGSPTVSVSPGVPEPIKALENPTTRERVRFYREIPYKVPKEYDEAKHLAEWTTEQKQKGYTKEIRPEQDREQLAEMRRKTSRRGLSN